MPNYDGLLVCSGPSLVPDLMKFRYWPNVVCSVNFMALTKVKFGRAYYLLTNDAPYQMWFQLKEHPDYEHITLITKDLYLNNPKFWTNDYEGKKEVYKVRKDKQMLADSPMHLVNYSQCIWTALHFLITKGCRTIFAAGLNCRPHKNGSYYGRGGMIDDLSSVLYATEQNWVNLIRPQLETLVVTFHSDRYSYDP